MSWGVNTIRSNRRRSIARAREVRESSSVEQPGDTLRECTRGRVTVKTKACCKFAAYGRAVIFGIHRRVKSRDTRSIVIFHKHWEYRCDTQRGWGLDVCAFINTRRDRVAVRVFGGRIRGVLNHGWAPYLHRYVVSYQLHPLRRESE